MTTSQQEISHQNEIIDHSQHLTEIMICMQAITVQLSLMVLGGITVVLILIPIFNHLSMTGLGLQSTLR